MTQWAAETLGNLKTIRPQVNYRKDCIINFDNSERMDDISVFSIQAPLRQQWQLSRQSGKAKIRYGAEAEQRSHYTTLAN